MIKAVHAAFAVIAASVAAIIIVASCGCGTINPPPGDMTYSKHSPTGFRCADYPRSEFVLFERTFIRLWEQRFNDGRPELSLRHRLAKLRVYCHKVIPHSFGGDGILEGLYDNKRDLQIATFDPVNYVHMEIHEGAYGHELMHVALEAVYGDPDGCPLSMLDCPVDDIDCFVNPLGCDHAKGSGPWTNHHHTMIDDVNKEVRRELGR